MSDRPTLIAMSALMLSTWLVVGAENRIVCLGDSITDGYTYGQIIQQAWREADTPAPAIICAGVGGDTAAQMAARIERDVLRFEPQLVTFSAGTNDALKGVSPDDYAAALQGIATKIKASGASMLLLTPCEILPKAARTPEATAAVQARLDAYEAIIRQVASEHGWPIAENRHLMQNALAEGKSIMAGDGIHPNYLGQSLMARAILDALGQENIALPETFRPKLFPGVVRQWKMRLAPTTEKRQPIPLTAESIAALQIDADWVDFTLETPVADEVVPEMWRDQIRVNGFATDLQKAIGKGLIQAATMLTTDKAKQVWIQLGGAISTVWLNGQQIHDQGQAWTGYHAGKERLEVTLNPGQNRVVIEVKGNEFFFSITDQLVWENQQTPDGA